MKKSVYLVLLLFSVVTSLSFTSCSKDDGNLDLAKYESVSAKYKITSENSPYQSIELGAGGDYIVIENNNYRSASLNDQSKLSLFGFNGDNILPRTRATNYNGVIYGTYTKLDDETFDLKGFGIIKVILDNNKQVNALSITPDNGVEMEFDVIKENVVESDDFTNSFCRTWTIEKVKETYYKNGKVVHQEEYVDKDDIEVEEVFFSKSGTYMVVYTDGTLGVSSWKWKDKKERTIYYSWDNEWESDCWVKLSFDGKTLIVNESFIDDYYDDEYEYDDDYFEYDKYESIIYLKEKK